VLAANKAWDKPERRHKQFFSWFNNKASRRTHDLIGHFHPRVYFAAGRSLIAIVRQTPRRVGLTAAQGASLPGAGGKRGKSVDEGP